MRLPTKGRGERYAGERATGEKAHAVSSFFPSFFFRLSPSHPYSVKTPDTQPIIFYRLNMIAWNPL